MEHPRRNIKLPTTLVKSKQTSWMISTDVFCHFHSQRRNFYVYLNDFQVFFVVFQCTDGVYSTLFFCPLIDFFKYHRCQYVLHPLKLLIKVSMTLRERHLIIIKDVSYKRDARSFGLICEGIFTLHLMCALLLLFIHLTFFLLYTIRSDIIIASCMCRWA